MDKIYAIITAVGGFVPETKLTNADFEKMVDTTDQWIFERTGIRERRILKDKDKATSYLATEAVKNLLQQKKLDPKEIDCIICATVTPDMFFPATANLVAHNIGATNAFGFDLSAACCGFLFAFSTAASFIETGRYKKVLVIGADKMSTIVDYTARATCILFGDGAGCVLLEATTEPVGVMDRLLRIDGSGTPYLHMKAGGSLNPASMETLTNGEHYIFQDGQPVFKNAVVRMADITEDLMKKNNLTAKDIDWLVPHQANLRVIDATVRRVQLPKEKVMINIEKYGNTTAATIPLCLWDWQNKLKKGDNLILCAFGGGFSWGSVWVKWAY